MEGETVFAKRPRKSAKKINYSEELDDSDEFMGNENEEISKYSENSDQNELIVMENEFEKSDEEFDRSHEINDSAQIEFIGVENEELKEEIIDDEPQEFEEMSGSDPLRNHPVIKTKVNLFEDILLKLGKF